MVFPQSRLAIPSNNEYSVPQLHFMLFEVEGNYTRVHCRDKRPLLSRALNYLEQRLNPQQFFRANRQVIINLDFITEVEPWINDGLRVTLQDGRHIEVSRRQTKSLLSLLEV